MCKSSRDVDFGVAFGQHPPRPRSFGFATPQTTDPIVYYLSYSGSFLLKYLNTNPCKIHGKMDLSEVAVRWYVNEENQGAILWSELFHFPHRTRNLNPDSGKNRLRISSKKRVNVTPNFSVSLGMVWKYVYPLLV